MNPLTNMKNVIKLSEQELHTGNKTSWHDQYRDSAWVFVGGLPFDLTEGDIVCIFSQYGEIVNINLIREKDTGKSKGFCFICYEDQRSTVLAVDNFNGIKILNRTIRVDHVSNYKAPKVGKKTDEETEKLYSEGCAPKAVTPKLSGRQKAPPNDFRETIADIIDADIKLPARLPIYPIKQEESKVKVKKEKKDKKKKEKKKKKKRSKKSSDDNSDESSNSEFDKRKKSKKKKSKKESSEDSDDSSSDNDSDINEASKSLLPLNRDDKSKFLKYTGREGKDRRHDSYSKDHIRSRSRSDDRKNSYKYSNKGRY